MRLAMYQPDIAQNMGTLMRLSACMNIHMDIIEPCGFLWNDNKLKRSGMDYLDYVQYHRHNSWQAFIEYCTAKTYRIALLTTKARTPYIQFSFQKNDILLLGQESCGVPDMVHKTVDARLLIPMTKNMRSLNIATAGAMVLGEALRQTRWDMV